MDLTIGKSRKKQKDYYVHFKGNQDFIISFLVMYSQCAASSIVGSNRIFRWSLYARQKALPALHFENVRIIVYKIPFLDIIDIHQVF